MVKKSGENKDTLYFDALKTFAKFSSLTMHFLDLVMHLFWVPECVMNGITAVMYMFIYPVLVTLLRRYSAAN